jgi:hypothetical protein
VALREMRLEIDGAGVVMDLATDLPGWARNKKKNYFT